MAFNRAGEGKQMPESYIDRLKKALHEGWKQFFDVLLPDDRQRLVKLLRAAYLEEVEDLTQFAQHIERMHYPHFRERLLRIAEEERAHVMWLREKLVALGGEVPAVNLAPKPAKNAWEALMMDLEEEKRSYENLIEALHIAEQADPEIAEGLRRIREEERQHREEILDMLAKSHPSTLPHDSAPGASWEVRLQRRGEQP